MNKNLKVGMKIKGRKGTPVKEELIGETCEITEIRYGIVFFKSVLGAGVMTIDELNKYFEIIEDKTFEMGDKVIITNGIFNGIEGKICRCSGDGKTSCVITSDGNMLTISNNNLELIKKKIYKETLEKSYRYSGKSRCKIKIRGRRTTVKLLSHNIEASVYCNKHDTYNKEEGINRAFKKALSKLLLKEALQ